MIIPEFPHLSIDQQKRSAARFAQLHLCWKAVRLHCLNDEKQPIAGAYASGFIRRDSDGRRYLYTAWHVVAGYGSPRRIEMPPPGRQRVRRSFLRVQMQDSKVTHDQYGRGESIGGLRQIDLPLYGTTGCPIWFQEPEQSVHDLNNIGLRVPRNVDAVKIFLPDDIPVPSTTEIVDEFSSRGALPTDRIQIVGYPYGYSVGGEEEPFAVVITRHVAGRKLPNPHYLLIDGPGTPGMSGAPIFIMDSDEHPRLIGLYSGVVRPDAGKVAQQELSVALGECFLLWHTCGENGPGLSQRGSP